MRPRSHLPPLNSLPALSAQIAAVDSSVLPYSYGIEIEGHYRETEASRLAPLAEPADGTAAVEGLGHRDAATEAKEAAVRGMER